VSDNSFLPEINSDEPILDRLARRIREEQQAVQAAGATVLRHALEAGDALIEAQSRVTTNWKKWLRDNCFLCVRTAQLYQQLARHREDIEAAIAQAGDLSLRAACRLISKPKAEQEAGQEAEEHEDQDSENPAPMLTDVQLVDALTVKGLDWFLENMPAEWRPQILARLRGPILRQEKARHPNTRMKRLKIVHNSTEPPTKKRNWR
jgi:hypothetical protein